MNSVSTKTALRYILKKKKRNVSLVVCRKALEMLFLHVSLVVRRKALDSQKELKLLLDMYKSAPKDVRDKVMVSSRSRQSFHSSSW